MNWNFGVWCKYAINSCRICHKQKKTEACADSINSDQSAHMKLNILHHYIRINAIVRTEQAAQMHFWSLLVGVLLAVRIQYLRLFGHSFVLHWTLTQKFCLADWYVHSLWYEQISQQACIKTKGTYRIPDEHKFRPASASVPSFHSNYCWYKAWMR